MNNIEAIRQRKSVRTYTGEPLDASIIEKIKEYIAGQEAPFGVKCHIEIIRSSIGEKPVKLGTYGFIKGATDFLALIIDDEGPLAEVGAAYLFEQVVLYCTSLGLGTCWLGGSFSRSAFKKQLTLNPGEKLPIVSPVGYASDKKHKSFQTLFGGSGDKPRKPFSANFFHSSFDTPLTEEVAGMYARPLEMVRLAPSANNKQSWRVVMDDKRAFHFYKSYSYGFDAIDLGIALCHFEQTCIEQQLPGHFEVLSNAPEGGKAAYVISWIIG